MHRAKIWGTVGSWVSQSEEHTNTFGGFKRDVMWHEMTINELVRWYLSATKPHRHIRRPGPNAYIAHAVMTPPETTIGTPALHCKALPPALEGPQISLFHTHMYIYIYIGIYIFKIFNCLCSCNFLNTTHLWQIWMFNYFFFTLTLLKWLKCMGSIFGCLALVWPFHV